MDITPLIPHGRKIIQSYGIEGFKVSGERFSAGIVLTPLYCEGWDAPINFNDMSAQNFLFFVDKDIDVLLLGAGKKSQFLNPDLRQDLKMQGLIVDVMDTGAACRTYNVLMAEGRRVGAALIPVEK